MMRCLDIMNKRHTILIIEDQSSIRDILAYSLKDEGYNVIEAKNGTEGLKLVSMGSVNLVILDLMLPDIDGYEICKKITMNNKVPIIMLTARNNMVDKIVGLEMGADDYITKPFEIKEVLVRIKVVLRRMERANEINQNTESIIQINDSIRIDKISHTVSKGDKVVKMKPREYDLLVMLAENKDIALSRDKLIENVWGYDFEGDYRTVDVHIQRLRVKLDDKGEKSIIETVFGIGYKLTND